MDDGSYMAVHFWLINRGDPDTTYVRPGMILQVSYYPRSTCQSVRKPKVFHEPHRLNVFFPRQVKRPQDAASQGTKIGDIVSKCTQSEVQLPSGNKKTFSVAIFAPPSKIGRK